MPTDMRSSLYSRMLKAFFRINVYEPKKEEGKILRDPTGHYIYETDDTYQTLAKWCESNVSVDDEDTQEIWEL